MMTNANFFVETNLEKLNSYLSASKDLIKFDRQEPLLPIIFIIGAPKSGSTLTSQILLHTNLFSKVSNFIARFWEAPYIGGLIEKAIPALSEGTADHAFISSHGQTSCLSGPHEFGRFWDRWFSMGSKTHKLTEKELSKIKSDQLQKELGYLEEVFEKPILFKNNTWCSFQANWLAKVFPRSIFVICERSILYNAQSLMLTRRQVHGNDADWWSMKPANFDDIRNKNIWEQVLLQAYHCREETRKAILEIPSDRVLKIKYKSVCHDPLAMVSKLIDLCNNQGTNLTLPEYKFPIFTNTDTQKLNDKDWKKLYEAYKVLGIEDEGDLESHGVTGDHYIAL